MFLIFWRNALLLLYLFRPLAPHSKNFVHWFLALLCVTEQQSYCHDVGVSRLSSVRPSSVRRPSVRRHPSFRQTPSSGFTPNFGDRYQISRPFFSACFSKFIYFLFYSNDISSESTHQIHSTNHAYSWGGSLPKLLKILWNLKFWIFAFFFRFR